MNIAHKLETEHSKSLTTAIVNYVGDDRLRLKELMAVFFGTDKLLSQRAAWPVRYVFEAHPHLLSAYYKKLIEALQIPNQHPAIYRNVLRALQTAPVPQKYQGILVDLCFNFIKNETQALATRAFAITVAANICKHYPELKNELNLLLNELAALPQAPAIRVRTKTALKELKSV
ncbi:MAG: hypothetical protein IT236_09660 [Bacteroidia bacterium]|nr:hypothetical protein [Bacteroidia bacterium]